jgi:hypothetical protein
MKLYGLILLVAIGCFSVSSNGENTNSLTNTNTAIAESITQSYKEVKKIEFSRFFTNAATDQVVLCKRLEVLQNCWLARNHTYSLSTNHNMQRSIAPLDEKKDPDGSKYQALVRRNDELHAEYAKERSLQYIIDRSLIDMKSYLQVCRDTGKARKNMIEAIRKTITDNNLREFLTKRVEDPNWIEPNSAL